MICQTVEQMNRVAQAGANKMFIEGYTFRATEGSTLYAVTNPEGHTYHCDPKSGKGGYCSCPFHRNNEHLIPLTMNT